MVVESAAPDTRGVEEDNSLTVVLPAWTARIDDRSTIGLERE